MSNNSGIARGGRLSPNSLQHPNFLNGYLIVPHVTLGLAAFAVVFGGFVKTVRVFFVVVVNVVGGVFTEYTK